MGSGPLVNAADWALTACLNQLDLTATAGALLLQTMLYKASDQNRQCEDNKLFATAKRLKIALHNTPHNEQDCKQLVPPLPTSTEN